MFVYNDSNCVWIYRLGLCCIYHLSKMDRWLVFCLLIYMGYEYKLGPQYKCITHVALKVCILLNYKFMFSCLLYV